jgi:hypothetical protein
MAPVAADSVEFFMNGNEGVLSIGTQEEQLLSARFGGAFLTRSDLQALAPQKRAHGMVAFVFEDHALYFFNEEDQSGGLIPEQGGGVWMSATAAVLASRSMSFESGDFDDADGIVSTPIATVDTDATTVDCTNHTIADGANPEAPGFGDFTGFAAWPTVTADDSAGAFNATDPIQFVGTYMGVDVVREATITTADGDVTVTADGPLETLSEILIPQQADDDGALSFGWTDIGPGSDGNGNLKRWTVVATSAANVHVAYGTPDAETGEDTVALAVAQTLGAYPYRIFNDSTADLTIYE